MSIISHLGAFCEASQSATVCKLHGYKTTETGNEIHPTEPYDPQVCLLNRESCGLTGFVIIHVFIASLQGERNKMVSTKLSRPVNEMPMSTRDIKAISRNASPSIVLPIASIYRANEISHRATRDSLFSPPLTAALQSDLGLSWLVTFLPIRTFRIGGGPAGRPAHSVKVRHDDSSRFLRHAWAEDPPT